MTRPYATDWRPTNDARREHIHGPIVPMDEERDDRRFHTIMRCIYVAVTLGAAAVAMGLVSVEGLF